jgi:hypothetical protein
VAVQKDTRPRIVRRFIVDDHIDLTGCVVLNCTFDGCIVHLDSKQTTPFFLSGNLFRDCRLTGSAWRNTMLRTVNLITSNPWEPKKPA